MNKDLNYFNGPLPATTFQTDFHFFLFFFVFFAIVMVFG